MKTPEFNIYPPIQESAPKREFSGLSQIMDQVLANEELRNSLRVGKVLSIVSGTLTIDDAATESRTRRLENGTAEISLGAMPFGRESVDAFGWGAYSAKEQLLVKLAHESAHAFQSQDGYEQALVDFLNGSNYIDDKFHPYIELYAFLNSKGVCNGLADMDVYHSQSRDTGLLSVNTLEDMTEFIGAYLISDEYFNFRLDGSKINLTEEDKKKIATLVVQIIGM